MPFIASTPNDRRAFRQLVRLNTISSQSILGILDMLKFAAQSIEPAHQACVTIASAYQSLIITQTNACDGKYRSDLGPARSYIWLAMAAKKVTGRPAM